jgi:hypothetical protein
MNSQVKKILAMTTMVMVVKDSFFWKIAKSFRCYLRAISIDLTHIKFSNLRDKLSLHRDQSVLESKRAFVISSKKVIK